MLFRYILAVLIFIAASSQCRAISITYNYTGVPFETFMGYFPPMTGSITVSCPGVCVGTYTDFENITLSAGFTLDTAKGASLIPELPEIVFGVDGTVESWSLGLFTGTTADFRLLRTSTNHNYAGFGYCGGACSAAAVGQDPTGVWSVESVPGPTVGAGLPGILTAIAALIGWHRSRRAISATATAYSRWERHQPSPSRQSALS